MTEREIAERLGFPGRQSVFWYEHRAIRRLWRERTRLQAILEGKLERGRDGKWAIKNEDCE